MSTADTGPVSLTPVKNEGELLQALAIREIVFIEEQHVPEGIERDAEDAKAYHVLAIQAGHAIGTGRLVMLPSGPHGEPGNWAQIGRMAVLKAGRKAGVGSMLLTALEDEARRRGVNAIVLHAQSYAIGFYQKHHYREVGEPFDEAGIPHVEMQKQF